MVRKGLFLQRYGDHINQQSSTRQTKVSHDPEEAEIVETGSNTDSKQLQESMQQRDSPVQFVNERDKESELRETIDLEEDIPMKSSVAERKSVVETWRDEKNMYAFKLTKRGIEYHQRGEYHEALKLFQTALNHQMERTEGIHIGISQTLANIGAVYMRQGKLQQAKEALEESLHQFEALRQEISNEGNDEALSKISTADVLNNLGNIACLESDYCLSLQYYSRAVQEIKATNGSIQELVNALYNIGRINYIEKDFETALGVLAQSLWVETELYGEDDITVVETMELIGHAEILSGNPKEALSTFSKALSIVQKMYGPVHETVASALLNVGMAFDADRNDKEALKSFAIARDLFIKSGKGSDDVNLRNVERSMKKVEQRLAMKKSYDRNESRFVPIGSNSAESRGDETSFEEKRSEEITSQNRDSYQT